MLDDIPTQRIPALATVPQSAIDRRAAALAALLTDDARERLEMRERAFEVRVLGVDTPRP